MIFAAPRKLLRLFPMEETSKPSIHGRKPSEKSNYIMAIYICETIPERDGEEARTFEVRQSMQDAPLPHDHGQARLHRSRRHKRRDAGRLRLLRCLPQLIAPFRPDLA